MEKSLKKLINTMHRAINEYKMIEEGDCVGVGISGGKDSLMLLKCLCEYQKIRKEKFSIKAIAVDIFGNTNYDNIANLCQELNVEFCVEKTNIIDVVFNIRQEKNPCSLCANLRRGILNSKAKKLGCNKVALGHHADDFIQTFFISLTKENRLNSMFPKTYLSRQDITIIRPFLYVFEEQIKSKSQNLPVIENNCPANKHSQREEIKQIIENLNTQIPNFKKNILAAITQTQRYSMLDKCKQYFDL